MADIYQLQPMYGAMQAPQQGGATGTSEEQDYINSLPPEEREAAIARLNAPISGDELAEAMKQGYRPKTIEEYRTFKSWKKSWVTCLL